MKILFIVSSAEMGFWLAELTHPYWHFSERGFEVTLASPKGGKVNFAALSDPFSEGSWEKDDLVSKGFLSDKSLVTRLDATVALRDVHPEEYDSIHVVGGGAAAFDLYPNEDLKRLLSYFWKANKVVGALCHGAIALGNIPDQVAGRRATGFSRVEDAQAEALFGLNFIPNFPQPVMEKAGIKFSNVEPWGTHVVVDGKLITGQNQQSASEYSIAYLKLLTGKSPVVWETDIPH
jgi:putative intracellular protease/amidase